MIDTPGCQSDLFEMPTVRRSIPSQAQVPMLELLKTLLTEAIAAETAAADAPSREAEHDEDHG